MQAKEIKTATTLARDKLMNVTQSRGEYSEIISRYLKKIVKENTTSTRNDTGRMSSSHKHYA